MSTATQPVMPGDTPLADIAEDVQTAREAILSTITEDPTRSWHPRGLIDAAKVRAGLSTTVVSIAFWSLVESGQLEVDERLVVRAVDLV